MKTYDELYALIVQRGVHAEFGEPGEGFGIEQNPHELATFLVRMQELGVQSVLEIGTGYKGGLSRFLARDMGWEVATVDINTYHHVYEGVHYAVSADRIKAPDAFWGLMDLLFIDADHRYENVAEDYRHYSPFATKVIAFHDTMGLRDCEGVKQLWFELIPQFKPQQIFQVYADEKQSGIGWIEL